MIYKTQKKYLPSLSKGLTLVELMVALLLSLLVVIIGGMALAASGTAFKTTDATAQLSDKVMIVTSILQRSVAQAGYQPSASDKYTREVYYAMLSQRPHPDIYGRSSTSLGSTSAAVSNGDINSLYSGGSGGGGVTAISNTTGDDLLLIRFQAAPENDQNASGDIGMLNPCTGLVMTLNLSNYDATDLAEMHKPIYAFYVDRSTGQGILYCKSWFPTSGNTNAIATPLADGVVAFKVLYGIYENNGSGTDAPTQWKTANAMNSEDWYFVKRVRIGVILQSAAGAGPAQNEQVTLYPLGKEFQQTSNHGSKVDVDYLEGRVYRSAHVVVNIHNLLTPRNE